MGIIDKARNGITNVLLGDEKRRLNETAKLLSEAYLDGPYQLPPEALLEQLKEIDSAVLQDLVNQLYWDTLAGYGTSMSSESERQRVVTEARRLWKYSPLAQWAVSVWTNAGLGESLKVTCVDPDADDDWQEFFTADRNAVILADDKIDNLSNLLIVTGERFLMFYCDVMDGEATIRKIVPEEIVEVITHPDDKSVPLFYKRQWTDTRNSQQTLYYPDYQIFFDKGQEISEVGDALDAVFRDGKTLAEYVLPVGAKRSDKVDEKTVAFILHIAYNQKEEDDIRGWSMIGAAAPYIRAHKKHIENRLAVSAAKAMYVREFKTEGGSRGVASVKAKLASRLSTDNYIDSNPPAAPGSSLVMNKAVDHKDLPVSTGASDAKVDNDMFAWFALLGMGLFPTSAGLDTSRWATALTMDKTQSMQWSRYQTFWSAQFKKMVKIVLQSKERYGGKRYTSYDATVSVDQFSIVDFPGVVSSLSQMITSAVTPLVDNGALPMQAGRTIVARLWRVALQALGISESADITSDEMFEIGKPEPIEAIQAASENYRSGKLSADQLAEFLIAEMVEGNNVKDDV